MNINIKLPNYWHIPLLFVLGAYFSLSYVSGSWDWAFTDMWSRGSWGKWEFAWSIFIGRILLLVSLVVGFLSIPLKRLSQNQ